MPRLMSSAMLAAIAAGELFPALFVEANFATGPVYIWSGMGPIDWNGHTWLGVGTLGSVSAVSEGTTVEARGITLTLSGIDPALLTDVLGEFVPGLPVIVFLGLFNAGALIASPLVSFSGRMDQPSVDIDGISSAISINCENRLIEMNVAVDRRYTADDQQRDFPGDLGFNFVNAIQEMTLYWGTSPTSSNNV